MLRCFNFDYFQTASCRPVITSTIKEILTEGVKSAASLAIYIDPEESNECPILHFLLKCIKILHIYQKPPLFLKDGFL